MAKANMAKHADARLLVFDSVMTHPPIFFYGKLECVTAVPQKNRGSEQPLPKVAAELFQVVISSLSWIRWGWSASP
jgi:hypothetical protein